MYAGDLVKKMLVRSKEKEVQKKQRCGCSIKRGAFTKRLLGFSIRLQKEQPASENVIFSIKKREKYIENI